MVRKYEDRKQYLKEYYREYYHSNPEYRAKQLERTKSRGLKNREIYLEWKKTLKCIICSESDSCCLEFHHLDPTIKDFELSRYSSKSLKFLQEEAKKCVVLCSNCHKKLHAGVVYLVKQ